MAESGRYLYAISRGLTPEHLTGTRGLADAPLDVVEEHGLAAVVSTVDLQEYGEEGLRRNLEDLAWLEQVARTHDAVVHAVAVHGPTAPMRLATICLGDDQVRSRLEQWREPLERALERVAGRTEWSVKAFTDAPEDEAAEPEPASGGPGAGAAYLRRRKEEVARRQHAVTDAARLGDELHTALSGRCVASRRLPPQDRRLTGHQGTMILNGAYLVDEAAAAQFREAAEGLAAAHPAARVEVQGPWPPYSFATLEES